MRPIIKQECVELEDIQQICDDDDDGDDNYANDGTQQDNSSDSASEQDSEQSDSRGQANNRRSIHVTVQREDISAAHVQEGSQELHDLGVDVYDQQTYERSVFDQVDRAITGQYESSNTSDEQQTDRTGEQNSSSINDLMRLIHDQNRSAKRTSEEDSTQARDEEILRLARQQRLGRSIKLEQNDRPARESSSLPRIPRVPKKEPVASSTVNSATTNSFQDRHSIQVIKSDRDSKESVAHLLDRDIEEGELSSISGDEASGDEYRPEREEPSSSDDDANENIDYQTDSDVANDDLPEYKERESKKIRDDGDFKSYAARIKAYYRSRAQLRMRNINDEGVESKAVEEMVKIDGNLQVPKDIWDNLFEHQKTGVKWLWELHQLGTGGILGDEMGLGKTIQMIAFLVALKASNVRSSHNGYDSLGPTVLVCPATVMHQWLQEFRKWYPPFRVAILHSTGTFSGDRKQLVRVIHKSNGILICSYPGVIIYQDYLHALDWHYAILDEGHKIKNPDSQVTLACKRFRTPHRLILSGSPVQNNLRELWSIFDFIYPGKLGTLPVFLGQFAIPITQGGYANASDMQVQIAYKCACVLRDTIKPFLLRRTKAEVSSKLKLPDRSEQVLFCKLTERQRKLYQYFLDSPTVRDIKRGTLQIFAGLIQLRKICNHPDIFDASECNRQIKQTKRQQEEKLKHLEFFSVDETHGHYQKSGKMMVVDALLKLWKKQGDKVLLFTQSRQMLKIFAEYMDEREHKYLSMDGSTPIGIRHSLIDEFNTNTEIFVFLLTTRVGGVGVNLIGANRIIIYDPDWNPSTDIQARERAWRIGQQRHVIIYRLLTAGTIEEKIYHRQVFKLYLTNRILKDAKQKRFFKTNDLHELFTLGQDDKNIETKALFDDDLQIDEKSIRRKKKRDKKRRKLSKQSDENNYPSGFKATSGGGGGLQLTEEKLAEMRKRAKLLSQMIALQYGDSEKLDKSRQGEAGDVGMSIQDIEPLEVISDDEPDSMGLYRGNPSIAHETCPSNLATSSQSIAYRPPVVSKIDKPKEEQEDRKTSKKKRKQELEYLVRQDVYRPATGGDRTKEDSRHKRDDYILERLFKNSNISGALKHDKIEGDSTADFKVVESEAEKVARDAIYALRQSRRLCIDSSFGIPNWTGRNGQMASSTNTGTPRLTPKNKGRAQQLARSITVTPSTSGSGNRESLLSSIRKRNQSNPVTIRNDHNNDNQSSDDDDNNERDKDFRGRASEAGAEGIADKIRSFLLHRSSIRGEAQTDEVLGFFKENFKPDKTAIFKAVLYKMCEFQRRGDKGFWKLKSEFRNW